MASTALGGYLTLCGAVSLRELSRDRGALWEPSAVLKTWQLSVSGAARPDVRSKTGKN